jgi:hypothetical protein
MARFSDFELAAAEESVRRLSSSKLANAILFAHSLEGFIKYVDAQRSGERRTEILCVDASEVVAWVHGGETAKYAFSFNLLRYGSFAEERTSLKDYGVLENLELIILRYLLFSHHNGYFLLDPHAREIALLFSANTRRSQSLAGRIKQMSPEVLRLSVAQLKNIRDFILSRSADDMPAEFKQFKIIFLPAWSESLAFSVLQSSSEEKRFREFFANGNYFTSEGGAQSIGDYLRQNVQSTIRADELVEFFATAKSKESFREVAEFFRLLQVAIVSRVPHGLDSDVMRRDADALAMLHILNRFMTEKGLSARFVLVTRSLRLHTLAAATPLVQQLVGPLRHPLFMPQIYQFSATALSQMAILFSSADAMLKPVLTAADPASKSIDLSKRDVDRALTQARDLFRTLVMEVLSRFITIQHTLEQAPSETARILAQAAEMSKLDTNPTASNSLDVLQEQIIATFQALMLALEERIDPFSEEVIAQFNTSIKRD